MQIIMSGLDYNLAPIGLREQLSFTKAQVEALTERIRRDVKGCSAVFSSLPATARSFISPALRTAHCVPIRFYVTP